VSKCKYYRESVFLQFTPECASFESGYADLAVHDENIEGDFCQFCGKKIKFKENKPHPMQYDEV
jgi:hypothetical protein